MAAIDCEAEVQIFADDGADANVILLVGLTIAALHDALHVGRTAIVGNRYGTDSLVHSFEPCSPVTLTTTRCAGSICSPESGQRRNYSSC